MCLDISSLASPSFIAVCSTIDSTGELNVDTTSERFTSGSLGIVVCSLRFKLLVDFSVIFVKTTCGQLEGFTQN